ncbi:MAG: hypothetical protein H7A39_02170 [Chlamydiales bacterium]|nr:hypothetical protein [Chlamydiales bacterium]
MNKVMTLAENGMNGIKHVAGIAATNAQKVAKTPVGKTVMIAAAVFTVIGLLALAGVGIYKARTTYLHNRDAKEIGQFVNTLNEETLKTLKAQETDAQKAGKLDEQGKLFLGKLTEAVEHNNSVSTAKSEMPKEPLAQTAEKEPLAQTAEKEPLAQTAEVEEEVNSRVLNHRLVGLSVLAFGGILYAAQSN